MICVVWGGALVVVGVLIAALAAPAFARYRVARQPGRVSSAADPAPAQARLGNSDYLLPIYASL